MTGWRRLAAIAVLFSAVAAGPAAAGQAGVGAPAGSTGVPGTATAPASSSTTTAAPSATSSRGPSATPIPKARSSRAFGSRMLRLGMRGSDVLTLQRDLTALNFNAPATGRFDALTLRRLKAFQRRYRLSVDGVAGPTAISELERLLSSKLHITETALAAKEIATGRPITTATADEPLPAGDSGLTGGVGLGPSANSAPEQDATLIGGVAIPAPGTPAAVVSMIDAANKIAFDPYIYGGGHASFTARGYDCSGSVSYVLHAAALLATPLDSQQFLSYGLPGEGNWITIYTNGPTHAYMEIAGLWFDTAAQTAANGNDRWSTTRIAEPGYGKFVPRHPAGW